MCVTSGAILGNGWVRYVGRCTYSCKAKEGTGCKWPVPFRMWSGQDLGGQGGASHVVTVVSVSSYVVNRPLCACVGGGEGSANFKSYQRLLNHIRDF